MKRSFEAYTPAALKPVRTFSERDMAERYVERMAGLGCEVTLKVVRLERRAA